MCQPTQPHRFARRTALIASFFATTLLSSGAVLAAQVPLPPLTKVRLTVVQFVASTGDYKRWDALGGEFQIGPDGALALPTLGRVDVGSMKIDDLQAEVSTRLQKKLGLLDPPDTTIQILAYPPVYVAGSVTTPGKFEFQPDMTVAQAVALAGGERRSTVETGLSQTLKLQSDLEGTNRDIIRTNLRIARLKDEFAGTAAFTPPKGSAEDPATAEIVQQEQQISTARSNEFTRQKEGLKQLAELYVAEIDALRQKDEALDAQVAQGQKQLENIKALVSSGSAVISRQNDVERAVADLRSQKLDNLIATMVARENLNHAQRDLDKLQDERQSDIATQLQAEQEKLEKLTLNQVTTTRVLAQSQEVDQTVALARNAVTTLSYAIVRQDGGRAVTLAADDETALEPGDLVRVTAQLLAPSTASAAVAEMDATDSP